MKKKIIIGLCLTMMIGCSSADNPKTETDNRVSDTTINESNNENNNPEVDDKSSNVEKKDKVDLPYKGGTVIEDISIGKDSRNYYSPMSYIIKLEDSNKKVIFTFESEEGSYINHLVKDYVQCDILSTSKNIKYKGKNYTNYSCKV